MFETQGNNAAVRRFHVLHGRGLGGLDRRAHQNLRPGAAEAALYGYRPFTAGEGGA